MSGLPDGVANGLNQSNHAGKDRQVWERPWTLEEMRQTSTSWSLAADSGLFLFLQDFSQRMLSKTHEIEKQLDGLIRDTKATDCCLHTVFNDFLMLSNTQFIENRVYDEEVEEPVPKAEALERQPELEKTREQKEAELIPKVQEAVNFGLRVLDSAFEQLDIKAGNSDSEDEEATDRVEPILEPKDLYVDRPLPYLIGSQLFMEQDDVGLGDFSSEEISMDSDRDSVIDSEDGKDADQSDEDFDQDEERPSSIKKKSSMLSDEDEGEESDIFGESDKEDDDDDGDDDGRANTGPSSFADELAARIKGEPISKPEGDRTSLSSASKKNKTKKEPKTERPQAIEDDSEELFGPPKMEDEDFSPFGGKGGLFSGGRGLFDDDEGDLFSDAPKQPVAEEKTTNTAHATEPVKPAKKIPSGAVSIFPENSLFGIPNDSDSVEGRENGSLAKRNKTQTSAPRKTSLGGGGGGLFDDYEEDDFFTGKSLKKSSSAGQEKPKQKKTVDLFGGDDGDDEDGDIFSESSVAPPPLQSRKEVVEEEEVAKRATQKKMPAGGVSMFGPGTKSLLTEALKKRQPSTSEESEENGPPPDVVKTPAKQTEKPQAKSLFSDDEDSQIFQTIPKSQSKPEPTTQRKAPLSIFDDEEEEDLFASAKKAKPSQAKAATPQVKKPISSSLFSDDEDQWISSKPSIAGKTEGKTGGMKSSASAPSSLPSVKTSPQDSLFDEDDDDLFAATKESSQKKHQRVSLLFEDETEDDEDKGSLFGFKTAVNNSSTTADPKAPVVASPAPSLLHIDEPDVTAPPPTLLEEKPAEEDRVVKDKGPGVPSLGSPLEGSESKKKPVGAVSLFGGINVLGDRLGAAKTKSPLDEPDGDDFLSKEGPPPMEKEAKTKKNTLSLFDDEEEEEGADWTAPISIPTKPVAKNTLKPAEERPRTKSSTGVFQDEELLFSHTQQRDNDPDVDIFATPDKSVSSRPSSVKSAAPTLFGDDDEDDLFRSVKPKAPPPKVSEKPSKPSKDEPSSEPAVTAPVKESEKPTPSPVKSKERSSRIGKLQANLVINPAAPLPNAVSRVPGGVSVVPGLSPNPKSPSPSSSGPSASLTPSPAGTKPSSNKGVSFDNPVQVSTLQSANKGRAKGAIHRRPQTRAARQTSAQSSVEQRDEDQAGPSPTLPSPALSKPTQPSPALPKLTLPRPKLPNQVPSTALPSSLPSQPPLTDVSVRPSVLTLPVSNTPLKKDSSKGSKVKVLPTPDEDDLFGSDSLFGSAPAPKPTTPSPKPTTPSPKPTTNSTVGEVLLKSESEKEKETAPQSLFDDPMGDLFKKVKPRSAKKAKASSFLEDEEEEEVEEDLFGLGKSSTPTTTAGGKDTKSGSNSTSKQDIFQDEAETPPKKHKERSLDASLFEDNVDIFADITATSKPKEKKSKKVETKSIFDDDMDDIFSPSTVKPVAKQPPSKSKKSPPSQDSSTADDSGNIFDDPLNVLGGN